MEAIIGSSTFSAYKYRFLYAILPYISVDFRRSICLEKIIFLWIASIVNCEQYIIREHFKQKDNVSFIPTKPFFRKGFLSISFEDLIQIFHNNVYQIPNYKVNYVKIDKTYNISNWIYWRQRAIVINNKKYLQLKKEKRVPIKFHVTVYRYCVIMRLLHW